MRLAVRSDTTAIVDMAKAICVRNKVDWNQAAADVALEYAMKDHDTGLVDTDIEAADGFIRGYGIYTMFGIGGEGAYTGLAKNVRFRFRNPLYGHFSVKPRSCTANAIVSRSQVELMPFLQADDEDDLPVMEVVVYAALKVGGHSPRNARHTLGKMGNDSLPVLLCRFAESGDVEYFFKPSIVQAIADLVDEGHLKNNNPGWINLPIKDDGYTVQLVKSRHTYRSVPDHEVAFLNGLGINAESSSDDIIAAMARIPSNFDLKEDKSGHRWTEGLIPEYFHDVFWEKVDARPKYKMGQNDGYKGVVHMGEGRYKATYVWNHQRRSNPRTCAINAETPLEAAKARLEWLSKQSQAIRDLNPNNNAESIAAADPSWKFGDYYNTKLEFSLTPVCLECGMHDASVPKGQGPRSKNTCSC